MPRTNASLVLLLVALALFAQHWTVLSSPAGLSLHGLAKADLATLLIAQAVWPLLPIWLASEVVARCGRSGSAAMILWSGAAAVWLFLGTNLACLTTTGNSITFHLAFLADAGALDMAGGSLALGAVAVTSAGPVFALATLALCVRLLRRALGARFARVSGVIAAAALWLVAPIPFRVAASTAAMRLGHLLVVPVPPLLSRNAVPPERLIDRIDHGLAARGAEIAGLLTRPGSDRTVRWPSPPAADVLFVVLESLRPDALTAETMPHTFAWGEAGGIRATRHYAETNTSELAAFALLYGRSPLGYGRELKAARPSPLFASLRAAGYRCAFFGSASMEWRGLEVFFSSLNFDELTIDREDEGWAEGDRRNVTRVIERLRSGERECIVLFLNSTHFPYEYAPEDERHRPTANSSPARLLRDAGFLLNPRRPPPTDALRARWWNRYRNAAGYVDRLLEPLLAEARRDDAVVVFTGDHGESFYEDGTWLHASKLSDVQTRVPLRISGRRIPSRTLSHPTRHVDVVPTVLAALGAELDSALWHGRDLLGPESGEDVLLVDADGDGDRIALLGDREERLGMMQGPWGGALRATHFEDGRARTVERGLGSAEEAAAAVDAVVAALERRSR